MHVVVIAPVRLSIRVLSQFANHARSHSAGDDCSFALHSPAVMSLYDTLRLCVLLLVMMYPQG